MARSKILEVEIIAGRGIKKQKRSYKGKQNVSLKDTSLLYCSVKLGKLKKKTELQSSSEPVWNEKLIFENFILKPEVPLEVALHSNEFFGYSSSVLGKVSIPLSKIETGETRWYPISNGNGSGEIQVKTNISVNSCTSEKNKRYFYVKVINAEDLIKGDRFGLSDPYVIIVYKKFKFKTSVKTKTLSPIWNETICIPLEEDDENPEIKLKVYDKDVIGSSILGKTHLFVQDSTEEEWYSLGSGKGRIKLLLSTHQEDVESEYTSDSDEDGTMSESSSEPEAEIICKDEEHDKDLEGQEKMMIKIEKENPNVNAKESFKFPLLKLHNLMSKLVTENITKYNVRISILSAEGDLFQSVNSEDTYFCRIVSGPEILCTKPIKAGLKINNGVRWNQTENVRLYESESIGLDIFVGVPERSKLLGSTFVSKESIRFVPNTIWLNINEGTTDDVQESNLRIRLRKIPRIDSELQETKENTSELDIKKNESKVPTKEDVVNPVKQVTQSSSDEKAVQLSPDKNGKEAEKNQIVNKNRNTKETLELDNSVFNAVYSAVLNEDIEEEESCRCCAEMEGQDKSTDWSHPCGGYTALHVAAGAGKAEIVLWLLRDGASCSQTDDFGKLPENYAYEAGHLELGNAIKHRRLESENNHDFYDLEKFVEIDRIGRDAILKQVENWWHQTCKKVNIKFRNKMNEIEDHHQAELVHLEKKLKIIENKRIILRAKLKKSEKINRRLHQEIKVHMMNDEKVDRITTKLKRENKVLKGIVKTTFPQNHTTLEFHAEATQGVDEPDKA